MLVATDVAARGVHVDDVELVIHVDPPAEHKAYLHRSGRTARAGSAGDVVTVVLPAQRATSRTLLRKAAITVTPAARHRRLRRRSIALVGEVAAYVKPAPRAAAQPQGGGGRSRAPTPSASAPLATSAAASAPASPARVPAGPGPRSRPWRQRRSVGCRRRTPSRPFGSPRPRRANAPKQGGGQGRGAQTTGAQRSTSNRSSGGKAPLRVGSLVSPSGNSRGNRRAQG